MAWEVIYDKKSRGHTFFQDLDWLSCGEQWQSLHLLTWHLRSCMLFSASSNNMRSDQWQTISVFPHLLPRFRLIVFRQQWPSFKLMVWYKRSCCSAPIRSCMLCSAGAYCMRSDQWQKNRGHTFFQDLDWLSCGERWQSLHLLIWHVRSCMLCSASSNDMRRDQWQTITVFPHLLPRFRLIVFGQQWPSF